jgi:hypothetical protein
LGRLELRDGGGRELPLRGHQHVNYKY